MAGIQISGLLANQSFDWKSIVDQLIAAESRPIETLTAQKTRNTDQSTAIATLRTAFTGLQDSVQAMRADNIFSLRTVTSNLAGTTWKTSSANGTPVGSYALNVTRLATAAAQRGLVDVGAALNPSANVSGLTLANVNTASAITAGKFTVNGAQITVATTDSLADVFAAIGTATGGDVAASYDPVTDRVSLASLGNNPIILGSSVDSSNFLRAMKLANNGTATVASSGSLGTVKLFTASIANSGLKTGVTGTGSFSINGVSLNYDASTDRVGDVISRINASAAGVKAEYDATNDRFSLTNSTTGDVGVGLADPSGFLAALGLTAGAGATFARGQNASFTVNGGPALSSASNALSADVLGITGLSVTVNSETAQTLTVQSDATTMSTYVQDFVTKFNTAQDLIAESTKVTVSGTAVSGSVLANNREVQAWSSRLRALAFNAIGGLSGSIKRLDDLGIDFNGTTSRLVIKNPDKLATALTEKPQDVTAFFLTANTGFVAKLFTGLTSLMGEDGIQRNNLSKANLGIDEQITKLRAKVAAQREQLTTAFIKMLEAQSAAESQNKTLTNAFFNKSNNN